MQYGLDFPPFGKLADPRLVAEVAAAAEASGWDGVFLWDHVMYRDPVGDVADPWIPLAAIAAATSRVRIGPMVTPLPRRRPWIVARQAAALDHLSGGRLTFGAGLAMDSSGRELSAFGEELDARTRAEMLDEGLAIIDGLWSGTRVDHHGATYTVDGARFTPTPVQRPRPPVWIGGRYPYRRPLHRAARWDGLFLIDADHPAHLAEARDVVRARRGHLEGFDIVINTPWGTDPAPWRNAGATWWLTKCPNTVASHDVLRMAEAGPPA